MLVPSGQGYSAALEAYLHPATEQSPISKARAEQYGRAVVNPAGGVITRAVFANVTLPGEEVSSARPIASAVVGRNIWVITVSLPHPVSSEFSCPATPPGGQAQSCPFQVVAHDTFLIDPVSGKFLGGYNW